MSQHLTIFTNYSNCTSHQNIKEQINSDIDLPAIVGVCAFYSCLISTPKSVVMLFEIFMCIFGSTQANLCVEPNFLHTCTYIKVKRVHNTRRFSPRNVHCYNVHTISKCKRFSSESMSWFSHT